MKQFTCCLYILFTFSLLAQKPVPNSASEKGASIVPVSNSAVSGSTYAVVVGISDYQDEEIPDLRFADKDALAFAGFLQSPAGGSLDKDHLKVLINKEATVAQFAIQLDWLWEVVKENDRVIIYFSGHGDVEKKSITQPGYLLCWDAPSRVYLAGGTMNVRDLNDVVSTLSIQNKAKVLLITDACRAGKLSGSDIGGAQATASNLAKQYANEIKILSCQPDEYSIEGEQWGGGRGAFSYHLLDGLMGMADGDANQSVSLKEIGRYLEDKVTEEVAPQNQNPMVIGNKMEKLTDVFPEILDQLKEGKKGQMQLFASTESRGIEDEVLAKTDSNIVEMYLAFQKTIEDKHFLEPTTACADFYYEQLSREPQLERLHSSIQRNYAAALQDDAQQAMNGLLKTDVREMTLSKISRTAKYQQYPLYLERAAELLGKQHYMYSILMARKLYFEGYLLSLEHSNPDKELGLAALEKFRGALSLQPNMPHTYRMMSRVFGYNMLQPDSMEHYVQLAADQAPSWVLPLISSAYILSTKYKQFDQAKYYLKKADQIDSNDVFVLNTWGGVFSYMKRFDEAEKYFKKAIQVDSTYFFPYNNLCNIYLFTQRFEDAEKYLKKFLQFDSTFSQAYSNLGRLYAGTRRYEEAVKYHKKAIQIDSTYTPLYISFGSSLKAARRYDEAEKYYKKAIQLDLTSADAYYGLGNLYKETQRFDEAEKYYKKAIQLDSTHKEACNNLGSVYYETQRYKEAIKYYKKAIQIDSTHWTAYANMGNIYQNLQRWEDAEEMALKAIQYSPPIGALVGMLGNAYTHMPGRLSEAKAKLDEGLAMSPDSPDVHFYLVQWYVKNNQQKKAWEYFEKGLEKDADSKAFSISDLQEQPDFEEMRKEVKWGELMKKYFPEQFED